MYISYLTFRRFFLSMPAHRFIHSHSAAQYFCITVLLQCSTHAHTDAHKYSAHGLTPLMRTPHSSLLSEPSSNKTAFTYNTIHTHAR